MLPRADINGSRPLGNIEAPTPTTALADARQDTFNRLAQVAIGKQFQAEILSRLNDGTFLVRVADTVARMNLPAGMRAGDSVAMTLVSAEPRPTFLLGQQANGPTASLSTSGQLADRFLQMAPEPGVAATTAGKIAREGVAEAMPNAATLTDLAKSTLGRAAPADIGEPALGKETLADTAAIAVGKAPISAAASVSVTQAGPAIQGSAPTSLSMAGRLINNILQSAKQDGTSTAVVGKTPLVFSTAASVPQLANALKDALVFSGLFYESHVAQWVSGERVVSDLKREPQATMRNSLPPDSMPAAVGLDEARPAVSPARESHLQTANGVPADTDSVALASALNTESAHLINLQLDTLENHRVLWQGELWPGQPLEWEISKDAPDRNAEDDAPNWKSAVRFDLPSLGLVSATIYMVGEHVQVQVRTATEAAAAALRAHGGDLAASLDAAGSPLDLLTVKRDGKI